MKSFHVEVKHTDLTVVGNVEDYWPAGKILADFGMDISSFEGNSKKLLEVPKHICQKNQQEHGYEPKEPQIDEKFPELSKFWYVFNLGKKQTHVGAVQKKLEQDSQLKDLKQLEAAKCFMEGIGFHPEGPESSCQIENAKYTALMNQVDILK